MIAILLFACLVSYGQPTVELPHGTTTTVQDDLKIYLLGGIISAITQKEVDFGKKYHVVFLDFGCLAPSNLDYYEGQNFKAFDLLNIQFGPKWQEELRPGTLGFSKWKEKNK